MKYAVIYVLLFFSTVSIAQGDLEVTEVSEFMPYQVMSFLTTTLQTSSQSQENLLSSAQSKNLLIPYRDGDLWGYSTIDKQIKIPIQYQFASRFYANIAYVKQDNLYFFINRKGEKLSTINWVETGELPIFQENGTGKATHPSYTLKQDTKSQYRNSWFDGSRPSNKGLIKVYNKNGRVGVIDIYGNTIVPTRYDDTSFINEGMIVTKLDEALGLYTDKGVEIIPPKYDIIYDLDEGLLRVEKLRFEGMLSSTGEEIISFRSKFTQVSKEGKYIKVINNEDKRGLFNLSGKLVVPVTNVYLKHLEGDLFIRKEHQKDGYSLFNASTLSYLSEPYHSLNYHNKNIVIAQTKDGGKVILDPQTGKRLHQETFDQCNWHTASETILVYKNGKQGLLNSRGEVVVPIGAYAKIGRLEEGYIRVSKGNSFSSKGVMNAKGKLILPTEYIDFKVLKQKKLIAVYNEKRKWGFFDLNGNQLTDFIYDQVREHPKSAYPLVIQNEYHGMIDETGTLLLPCIYKSISMRTHYIVIQNKEGKYGTTDKKGKIIVPCLYDRYLGYEGFDIIINEFQEQVLITNKGDIGSFGFYDRIEKIQCLENQNSDNLSPTLFFLISKNGLKGVISHEGEVIIPPKYYKIYYQAGSLFLVDYTGKGDTYGYVDTEGREFFKN